jgi:DNA-binding NarL/FixJ family response regulator
LYQSPTGVDPPLAEREDEGDDVDREFEDVVAFQGMDMIRVAIVDDHPIARRGVEQVLTETGAVHVVASAADPSGLLASLTAGDDAGLDLDLIVLDLYHDGDEPCLDAVSQLSAGARVLVMSVSGRPGDVVGAIRAGAAGYITKLASPEAFVSAVEAVAAGGFYLSSQLADILQAQLGRPQPQPQPQPDEGPRPARQAVSTSAGALSRREEETLSLIARGFTHAQAATRMGVSKATVDTYIERIRTKLQVGNKAELTRAALTRLSARDEG